MSEQGHQLPLNPETGIVGRIINRLRIQDVSFKANDNIAEYLLPGEAEQIETEVAGRLEGVLAALIIDTDNDHNTQGTARRMAKLWCREVFAGRYQKRPTVTEFPNAKKLNSMYYVGPIKVRSTCSHHFCPITGSAWVGIVPGDTVAGLSKFSRIVDWVCSRPQIQEEMVTQVADELEAIFKPRGLAVVIKATHTCMTWRGVKEDEHCEMGTNVMRGVFMDNPATRAEFLSVIKE